MTTWRLLKVGAVTAFWVVCHSLLGALTPVQRSSVCLRLSAQSLTPTVASKAEGQTDTVQGAEPQSDGLATASVKVTDI